MIAKVTRMHEFRRSMQGFFQNKWQRSWVIICLISIAAGLVFSRALLSIASVLVVVPWFFASRERRSIKKPFIALLCMSAPVLFSGLWSSDTQEWWRATEMRIPLFTMLLGVYAVRFTVKEWLWISSAYLLVIGIGCLWSIGIYLSDTQAIQASYLKAKVLPTLADQDYVRFSWMTVLAVLLSIKNLSLLTSQIARVALLISAFGFIVYLHLLAAKTGLLCLYTAALVYFGYLLFIRKKWKQALLIVVAVSAMASLAFISLPTLRNRVQYIRYDFSLYADKGSAPGYNDAARWLSVKAAYHILQENPVTGVGFGDLRATMNSWHDRFHAQSLSYERFLPACEWMVYGAASGWPGLVLFSIGLGMLLYATAKRNIMAMLFSAVALIPIVFDDTLEGQLGTAILAFIVFFAQTTPEET